MNSKSGSLDGHGGAPQRDWVRLGAPARSILDFSVSLNPLGPPPVIRERWGELLSAVGHYPSVAGDGVGRYYERVLNIPPSCFLAGNGSTEMIYLVPRVLGFKRVGVIAPSYHDYERASLLAGAEVIRWPLAPDDGFAFPEGNRLSGLVQGVDAVWIGRPNNPTGSICPMELILDLALRFPQKWFIIDEAFIQFLPDWRGQSLLTGGDPLPNLLVIHSLTKFFALPGLRLGGIVGSEPVISRLKGAKEPWTVNGIADRVAVLLTDCSDYEEETRASVTGERDRVFQTLRNLDGIIPFPSQANYILCRWERTGNLDDLLRHLLLHGLYVRDCRNFPGLEDNYFRVGLKCPQENDLLVSLISSFSPG